MKRITRILIACAGLAACDRPSPVTKGADNTAGLPAINEAAPDVTASRPTNASGNSAEAEPSGGVKIPAALHGRWGMAPLDCTSTRGDAKGLLVVTADELRFYESVARPTGDAEAGPDSIRGDFAFTGEGQSWTKFQSLALQGRDLVRTDSNPTASYTYAKCT